MKANKIIDIVFYSIEIAMSIALVVCCLCLNPLIFNEQGSFTSTSENIFTAGAVIFSIQFAVATIKLILKILNKNVVVLNFVFSLIFGFFSFVYIIIAVIVLIVVIFAGVSQGTITAAQEQLYADLALIPAFINIVVQIICFVFAVKDLIIYNRIKREPKAVVETVEEVKEENNKENV